MTGLDSSALQIKTKLVSCCSADSNPVKQEVNGTIILPPLVFPVLTCEHETRQKMTEIIKRSSLVIDDKIKFDSNGPRSVDFEVSSRTTKRNEKFK